MRFIILFTYLLAILLNKVNCEILNALAYNFDDTNQIYSRIIDEFNEKAKEDNLDVEIKLNLLTYNNSTLSIVAFGTMIEQLLKNNKKKYELYFYDNLYTHKIGKYLLDLSKYIEKEHIDMYDQKIVNQTCVYKDKIVGLPVTLINGVLYSNTELLKKYNQTIPETWDELIKTGKYILDKEKKINPNLIGYNGLFNEGELAIGSLYEFIHSFRKSPEDPFPEITSPEATKALKYMKKLKKELANDNIFKASDVESIKYLYTGNAVFLRYLIFPDPILQLFNYTVSRIPGDKKGVSASILGGFNIGIIDDIEGKKKEYALKAFKYFTSKEVQKRFLMMRETVPGITSLFDDPEVCMTADCDLFKSFQYISRPGNKIDIYDEYTAKYRTFVYDYLYRDKSLNEVIRNIDNILSIYTITLDTTETKVGLIIFTILSVLIGIMLLSLVFLFKRNFQPFFKFLSIDFWMISVLGCIAILSSGYTEMGSVKASKCDLGYFLLLLGFNLCFIPLLYKLIVNIPEENNFSNWIKNHKYLFLIFFLSIDIILNTLVYKDRYNIKKIIIFRGQNFEVCDINTNHSRLVLFFEILYKLLIVLIISVLIFAEWNLSETVYDLRFFVIPVYIDILVMIIILLFTFIVIQNYISNFLIKEIIIIIGGVSNYIFIYGFRLVLAFLRKHDVNKQFIKNINDHFINENTCIKSAEMNSQNTTYGNTFNVTSESHASSTTSDSDSAKKNLLSKLIDYHYSTDSFNGITSYKGSTKDDVSNSYNTTNV